MLLEVFTSMLLLAQSAPAAQEQVRTAAAITKGIQWLLAQKDGLLRSDNPGAVDTSGLELLVLTLASHRVDEGSKEMVELVEAMVRRTPETTRTASLQAMAFRKLDPVKYFPQIVRSAQFLVDTQCENGQWGDGRKGTVEGPHGFPTRRRGPAIGGRPASAKEDPVIIVRRTRSGTKSGDNSNSVVAALGLRACMEAGVYFEKDMIVRSRGWWNRSQRTDGGWGECGEGEGDDEDRSNGGMTAGAVAATCIYKHFLDEDFSRNASVFKGWQWLRKEYSIKENPGLGNVAHFEYLLSLERVALLMGKETVEEHAWYAEGCEYLISRQEADGRWNSRDFRVRDVQQNTCYAILFLLRDSEPLPATVRIPAPPHTGERK